MAKKKVSEEDIVNVAEVYSKSEQFFNENKKMITIVVGAIVVLVGGYYAYNQFVFKPKVEESVNASWAPTFAWENDSLEAALNGTMDFVGLKNVYEEYDGTPEGDLANYKLGIAFMNQGEFQQAIDHLSLVDYDDNMVGPLATGCIGDCLMELGQTGDAIGYYEQAAEDGLNDLITPYFLKKAGLGHQTLNRYGDALAHYERIRDEYPYSVEARDITKYIAYCEEFVK